MFIIIFLKQNTKAGLYINFFSYLSIRTSDHDINLSELQIYLSIFFMPPYRKIGGI
jgi:hypothetical protein